METTLTIDGGETNGYDISIPHTYGKSYLCLPFIRIFGSGSYTFPDIWVNTMWLPFKSYGPFGYNTFYDPVAMTNFTPDYITQSFRDFKVYDDEFLITWGLSGFQAGVGGYSGYIANDYNLPIKIYVLGIELGKDIEN